MNLKFWKKDKSPSLKQSDIFPTGRKNLKDQVLHEPISVSAMIAATAASIAAGAAGTGVVGIAIGSTVIGLTALGWSAVALGISLLGAYMGSQAMKKDMGGSLATGGILANAKNVGSPVRVIYGTCRVGGNIFFMHTVGGNKRFLHMTIGWGEGPIEGFNTDGDGDVIWFDNNRISYYQAYKGKDLVDYSIQYGSITGDCVCTYVDGAHLAADTTIDVDSTARMKVGETIKIYQTDTTWHTTTIKSIVDANTVELTAGLAANVDNDAEVKCIQIADPDLTLALSTHTDAYRGTAYSWFKLVYAINAFQGVPNITAEIKGKRIYDTRDGLWKFSNNFALVMYDFMTNERYGLGIPSALFEVTSVNTAAYWCDTEGFTFDGVIADRKAFSEQLEDMLRNARLMIIWSEGTYKFVTLGDDTAVMNLDEDDIVDGSFSIEVPGIPETPNRVKFNFMDADDDYRVKNLVLEEGNGEQYPITDLDARPLDIDLIGITDFEKASKLCTYHLLRARANKLFKFTAGARAMSLEPGDCINLTYDFPGWTNEKIRVVGMDYVSNTTVNLVCAEESATIYDNSVLVSVHQTYDTTLPDSFDDGEEPTDLVAKTGPDVISTPTESQDAYIEFQWQWAGLGVDYELQWRKETEKSWNTIKIPDTVGSIDPLVAGPNNTGQVNNPTSVQVYDHSGAAYTDETVDATDADVGDVGLLPATVGKKDFIAIGYSIPFDRVKLLLSTAGVGKWTLTWEYWNGNGYVPLEGVEDPTTNFMAPAGTYNIDFIKPTDWEQTTCNGTGPYYFIRGYVTSKSTSTTTQPLGTRIYVATRMTNPMVSGSFEGSTDTSYVIEIDGNGDGTATVDTIKWSDDGGATWDDTLVDVGEVYKAVTACYSYDLSGPTYADETVDANDAGANDVAPLMNPPAVGDAFYVGYTDKFDKIIFNVGTAGATTSQWTLAWQYWDGTTQAWKEINKVQDETNEFCVAGTRIVSYGMPAGWEPNTVNSTNAYWVRAYVSATTGMNTQPLITQIWVCKQVDWIDMNNGLKCKFPDVLNGAIGDRWSFEAHSPNPVKKRVNSVKPGTFIAWQLRTEENKLKSEWRTAPNLLKTWAPLNPDMSDYTPTISMTKQDRQAKVDWSTWRGADNKWFRYLLYYDDSASVYNDIWDAASKDDTDYFACGLTTDDYIYLGSLSPFGQIKFLKGGGTAQAVAATLSGEYYDGGSWVALTGFVDGSVSTDGKPFSKNGTISWVIPEDWQPTEVGDSDDYAYWIRLKSSANLTAAASGDYMWSTQDNQVKNYNIYCSTETTVSITETNLVGTAGGKDKNYVIKNLSPGNTYSIRVLPLGWADFDDSFASESRASQ